MKRKLAVVTAMIIALAVSNQVIAQTNSNSTSTLVQDHSEALVNKLWFYNYTSTDTYTSETYLIFSKDENVREIKKIAWKYEGNELIEKVYKWKFVDKSSSFKNTGIYEVVMEDENNVFVKEMFGIIPLHLVTDQNILDELKIASPPSATPQTTGVKFTAKTGETPYAYCYGENKTCTGSGCSQIKVITPNNSDVLVTLKQNERVVAHAYISAGSNYTFQVPNGTYQPFFYYGRNWDSEKEMAKTNCGTLRGGFAQNEHFSKDTPETLSNDVLTYELILQQNGNFSTIPSNRNEAF